MNRYRLVFPALCALFLLSAPAVLAETFVVDSTEDTTSGVDGVLTLREAIIAANANGVSDAITFDLPADSVILIQETDLPPISDAAGLTIDGQNEIVVEYDILGAPAEFGYGLRILSANNTIRGLTIAAFDGNGIEITGASASGNTVAGCVIQDNGGYGIRVELGAQSNIIGGSGANDANVVVANTQSGIRIDGANNNQVLGNYIGLDFDLLTPLGNGNHGVAITNAAEGNTIGGAAPGAGNTILGNLASGIYLSAAPSNTIQGNYIGTDAAELVIDPGNLDDGIRIEGSSPGNLVGGALPGEGNVIAYNLGNGVLADGAAAAARILGNQIYGNVIDPIRLVNNANSNDGGLTSLAPPVITSLWPLTGTAPPNARIEFFADDGFYFAGSVSADALGLVTGFVDFAPFIGLDIQAAATANPASASGVTSEYSAAIAVPELPAVTVNTLTDGVSRDTSSLASLLFNPPGGDITLREAILAANNTPGARTINFNVSGTIALTSPLPTLQEAAVMSPATGPYTLDGNGNITLDGSGLEAGANAFRIQAPEVTVDGFTTIGFSGSDILVDSFEAFGIVITGCTIGHDGAQALDTGGSGIEITNEAGLVTVGGAAPGEGNIISGNQMHGIYIHGASVLDIVMEGNIIGEGGPGQLAGLGNGGDGIRIGDGAGFCRVGQEFIATPAGLITGVCPGFTGSNPLVPEVGNVIAGNLGAGIRVLDDGAMSSFGNSLQRNLIFGNTAGGILLEGDANDGVAAPVLALDLLGSSYTGQVATSAGGFDLFGTALVEVFTDDGAQGQYCLEEILVDLEAPVAAGDFAGSADLSALAGRNLTARVTYDSTGNTSAFSTPVRIDLQIPSISINPGTDTVECGGAWNDAGAVAQDDADGNVPLTGVGTVDTSTPGEYPVAYNYTDQSGKIAQEQIRTVTVVDNTPPEITLQGEGEITLACGETYSEPGASAQDPCPAEGISVDSTNDIVPGTAGTYTVTYNAADGAGNPAPTRTRTVIVVDSTKPTLTLLGDNPLELSQFETFTDPGFEASDDCGGGLIGPVFVDAGAVDSSIPGTYQVLYSATDVSMNTTEVFRQVNVIDDIPPSVTLSGPSPSQTETGPVSYTVQYSGADAVTLGPGDVQLIASGTAAAQIQVSGAGLAQRTIELSGITGTGTLAISVQAGTASDTAGNGAAGVGPSTPVTVVDNTPPAISIGPPSVNATAEGPVEFAVAYSGASEITLSEEDVVLVTTGDVLAGVTVTGSGLDERTVTVSGISGTGTLAIEIGFATAVDAAGNLADSAGPSEALDVSPGAAPEGEAANEGEFMGEGEGEAVAEGEGEGETAAEGEASSEGEAAPEGEGEAHEPGAVVAIPDRVSFGLIPVGATQIRNVYLQNTGSAEAAVRVSAEAPFEVLGDEEYTIQPGALTIIELAFAPESAGQFESFARFEGDMDSSVDLAGAAFADAGSLQGMVLDGNTGNGLACASVVLSPIEGGDDTVVLTGIAGEFNFDALPAGLYLLQVNAPRYETFEQGLQIVANQRLSVAIRMAERQSPGVVTGLVTEASTGNAVSGVRVVTFLGNDAIDTTYTCAEGRYELPLPAAKAMNFELLFLSEAYEIETVSVEAEENEAAIVDAELTSKIELPIGGLDVEVLEDATGDPIAGARVEANKTGVGYARETSGAGIAAYLLEAGTYSLSASAQGFAVGRASVQVRGGDETASYTFRLISSEEKSEMGCGPAAPGPKGAWPVWVFLVAAALGWSTWRRRSRGPSLRR